MNCIVFIPNKEWSDAYATLEKEGLINIKIAIVNSFVDQSIYNYWEKKLFTINSYVLQKGVFPDIIKNEIYYSSLTNDSIVNYAADMLLAEIMMDRVDPCPDKTAISPFERRYYIKKAFSFWEKIIKEYYIDLILYNESPHGWADYPLYAIAKQHNIRFFLSTHTIFTDLRSVSQEIGFPSDALSKKLFSMTPKEELLLEFRKKVEKLRNSYADALPIYMKKQADIDSVSKFNFWAGRAMQFVKNFNKEVEEIQTYFSRTISRKNGIGVDSNNYFVKEVIERKKKKNKLKTLEEKYNSLSVSPDLSKKYVYFPLHYQPERTSNPEGHFYEDQLMLINLLEKTLPEEYNIYLKEHKSQFYTSMSGNQGRWSQFYQKCLLSSRVKLLNMDSNQFELIDNAEAVIAITGTAGFESLCRNKKVISFGKSWYRSFQGVLDCSKDFDSKTVIEFLYKDIDIEVMKDLVHFVEISHCLGDVPEEEKLATMLRLAIKQ